MVKVKNLSKIAGNVLLSFLFMLPVLSFSWAEQGTVGSEQAVTTAGIIPWSGPSVSSPSGAGQRECISQALVDRFVEEQSQNNSTNTVPARFVFHNNENGTYGVDAIFENKGIVVRLNSDGISIMSLNNYRFPSLTPESFLIIAKKTEDLPLGEEAVKSFIESMSDPATVKKVQNEYTELNKVNAKALKLFDGIKKLYDGFQEKFCKTAETLDANSGLSGASSGAAELGELALRIENFVSSVEKGETSVEPERKKEIRQDYDALRKKTRDMTDRYMKELRSAENILMKLGRMFEAAGPEVSANSTQNNIEIFINVKKAGPSAYQKIK